MDRKFDLVFLTLLGMFFLVACSTSKITQLEFIEVGKITERPVEVFSEEEPSFDFKVICDATLHTKGWKEVPKTLKGYSLHAKRTALECGAPMAIIKSVQGVGDDLTVKIQAIRPTSLPAKLFDYARREPQYLGHMTRLAMVQDVSGLSRQLDLSEVSQKRKERAKHDNLVLDSLLTQLTKRGQVCPVESINFLVNTYGARLAEYSTTNPNAWSTPFEMYQFLECPVTPMKLSFSNSENKKEYLNLWLETISTLGKNKSIGPQWGRSLKKTIPAIDKEVSRACASDNRSVTCLRGQKLKSLYRKI